MEKILYLPIETIAREFDARLLLAHQALSRGYSIVMGQKHNVFKAAEILGYGIYFYKSHGVENFPKSKNSKKTKFKYISLDEEGLVFIDDNEYLRNSKPHKLKHLDIVFTWGSYQRSLLIKANSDLKSKTIPVGNPRFDLLRPEFKILYNSASKKICKKWSKYILINTRFAPGNFSRLYGCSYIESREHRFITIIGRAPSGNEKDFLLEEEKYYKELFNRYVEMLTFLSPKFPEINFILRPHPSEDIINWKEALKGLKNVYVIFEGSAVDWILGALAVIHTGCTTGIEAWALKKVVIAYNPNSKEGIEPPLPNKFGIKINDLEQLTDIIEKIINGQFEFKDDKKQLKIAKSFIESITRDYSVTRFLNVLDKIYDIESYESGNPENNIYPKLRSIENIKGAFKLRILKFLSKYQPVIRKLTGKKITGFIYGYFKKYPGLFAQFKKFPELRSKEIRDRLSVYDGILNKGFSNDYLIQKIATDTYLINKR